uniref:S100/CaBP-9k-type calcium binding subdomain domain-containing protein n=1 Tax=Leptobrachium leishanense TaxID=445787 RepID=A0A8C5PZR8_9ANUR
MSSTKLETAITLLVDVFDKYSEKEGDSSTLSKKQFKKLLKNELGGAFIDHQWPRRILDRLTRLDFTEYMVLVVGALAMSCYDFFQQS